MSHMSRITYSTQFACLAILLLASTGCFAGCTEQRAADLERGASRPQNIAQLLTNLKLAFDQGPLLDPEFYTDSNLMKFFNGTSVQWRLLSAPAMYIADITPSPSLVGIKGISVRTWKNGAPLLDSEIRIEVSTGSELTLGGVRKVFGGETWTVFPEGPMHPMAANIYMPPTPFGIEYVKTIPPVADGCRATRTEAKFSADVHPTQWQGLRLHGPDPQHLPDQPMVISTSLKAMTE